jgi:molecular chaperone DnaK
MKEAGDKVNNEDKKAVEEKLEALKALKDSADLEAIKKAADELANVAQKVGAAMYQNRPEAEVKPEEAKAEPNPSENKEQ